MLILQATERRLLTLMEKGAKLIYYIRAGNEDYPSFVSKITIQHNGKELVLSRFGHWDKEPSMRSVDTSMADRLRKHPDVRSAYAGYQADFARTWREMYVHKNVPAPRWITEQWESPTTRY